MSEQQQTQEQTETKQHVKGRAPTEEERQQLEKYRQAEGILVKGKRAVASCMMPALFVALMAGAVSLDTNDGQAASLNEENSAIKSTILSDVEEQSRADPLSIKLSHEQFKEVVAPEEALEFQYGRYADHDGAARAVMERAETDWEDVVEEWEKWLKTTRLYNTYEYLDKDRSWKHDNMIIEANYLDREFKLEYSNPLEQGGEFKGRVEVEDEEDQELSLTYRIQFT